MGFGLARGQILGHPLDLHCHLFCECVSVGFKMFLCAVLWESVHSRTLTHLCVFLYSTTATSVLANA